MKALDGEVESEEDEESRGESDANMESDEELGALRRQNSTGSVASGGDRRPRPRMSRVFLESDSESEEIEFHQSDGEEENPLLSQATIIW